MVLKAEASKVHECLLQNRVVRKSKMCKIFKIFASELGFKSGPKKVQHLVVGTLKVPEKFSVGWLMA